MTQILDSYSEPIPGVQVEFGLKQCLGKWDLYKELLAVFWEDYGEAAATLAADGETQSKMQLLHHIRGASTNLGLNDLAESCMELKNLLETQGNLSEMRLREFATELTKTGASIKTLDSRY